MYAYQQPQQQQQAQIIGALTTHGGYHPYVVGQSTHGNTHAGFVSQAVPFGTSLQGGNAVASSTTAVRSTGGVVQGQMQTGAGLGQQTSYIAGQPQFIGGGGGAGQFIGGQPMIYGGGMMGSRGIGAAPQTAGSSVPVLSSAPLYAGAGSYSGMGMGGMGGMGMGGMGGMGMGSYAGSGYGGGFGSYGGGAGSYGAGSYGHPGQQVRGPEGPSYNRGYFYDDYIHDRHSPRRSYAAFRDARMPVPEGDVIYRHTIRKDDDFVLPRRSPRSEAIYQQQQQQMQQQQQQQQPSQGAQQQGPSAVPTQQSFGGPATIEVVEAKDLPTSILDKTDPYVRITIGGKQFSTTHKEDAGKAARWGEVFTLENSVRTGLEGLIEIRDKDTLKDDAIASSNFFLENGDRWFTLKPKGQVRLNVKGVNN